MKAEILLLLFTFPYLSSSAYMSFKENADCSIACGNFSLSCFKQCFTHLKHSFDHCIKYCKYYMKQCDFFCFCIDCKGSLRPPNPRRFVYTKLTKTRLAKSRKPSEEISNLSKPKGKSLK
ncbi:Hypothetical predicted protein [Octopus vulgaris]|uniref:Uncharacterized protein n=1 Tax=Octopus vulgaris TaxID=6645 RepID=A0AA36FFX1_OCTVU|nr:Hypothetical predicted protein [Octopus vulgaris]